MTYRSSCMNTQLILGCPGTGKTTTLLNVVKQAIKNKTPPNRIAYVSFSVKAVQEVITRAVKQFKDIPVEDFIYFRTLHGLGKHLLQIPSSFVLSRNELVEFSELTGNPFSKYSEELYEDSSGFMADRCLRIYNLSRARQVTLKEQWEKENYFDLSFETVEEFVRSYEEFKKKKGMYDFSDFLDKCDIPIAVDLFIVDEAQDLTKQQWEFVKRTSKRTKKLVIAGDDDQAIYEWAGADLESFLSIKGDKIILPTSHRLPKAAYELAESLVNNIQDRYSKKWKPKELTGTINWVADLDCLDIRKGTWLMLARHRFQLRNFEKFCRMHGVTYFLEEWSYESNEVKAALDYNELINGNSISFTRAKNVIGFISGSIKIKENRLYQLSDFPYIDKFKPWHLALDRFSDEWICYIKSLLENNENLTRPGRVIISTIHGAKGGEAENVIIATDVSKKVIENIYNDSELRVWYVAVTRTSDKLFFLTPKKTTNISHLIDF